MASELEVGKVVVGDSTNNHAWVTTKSTAGYYSGIKLTRGAGTFADDANNNFGFIVTDAGLSAAKFTSPGADVTGRTDFLTINSTGTATLTNSNSGLVIQNSGASDKEWRVGGGSAGQFLITEVGVADVVSIAAGGLATFSNGISNERGIYGGTLSVADDAVGEITPPRQATFMTLSYNATSDYPSHWGGLLYMDVGLSIVSNVVAGPSSAVVGVNSDVTGTTGTDGKTTVGGTVATGSGQIGKIRIENRHGTSVTYNYNFFG